MHIPDEQLLENFFAGDRRAFDVVVMRHTARVQRFVRAIVHDEAVADDVTQETFIKAWRNIKKFDRTRSFGAWLMRIAHNTAIDFVRARGVEWRAIDHSFEDDAFEYIPSKERAITERLADKELVAHATEAMNNLSRVAHEIVLLHLYDGLTFQEIADVVSEPLNTVKSRYRRALISLQAAIIAKNTPRVGHHAPNEPQQS